MSRFDRRGFLAATLGGMAVPDLAPGLARAATPQVASAASRIVVSKRERVMRLYGGQTLLTSFRVALGKEPYGPKVREGDGRTPEGTYYLQAFKPDSYFYRSILISYPSPEDRARARSLGVRPGGAIMVHGLDPAIGRRWRDLHWMFNWTNGCIAVTNAEMDILWTSVGIGVPIEILP